MKKWIVYVLGLITGVTLTFILAFFVNLFRNSENRGLEMFETPGEYMEYSRFEVIQVIDSGRALAHAENIAGPIVLLIPNENQRFYDDKKSSLKKNSGLRMLVLSDMVTAGDKSELCLQSELSTR